jgi:excinuclease ABC subunit A
LTAKYLSGAEKVALINPIRSETQHAITITGASEHNLKNLTVSFPLRKIVAVTGVSGSGKSTLVHDTLYGALKKDFGGFGEKVGRHKDLRGHFQIDAIEMVDQSPIGRSPRSNPATYTKAFDGIRDVFSQTRHAKIHSIPPGHFSFNVPGGRCETCQGEGVQTIDMQFMADVVLTCEVCKGKRFKKEVLSITYQGKNIYDVLQMSVTEAVEFFEDIDSIANKLRPLEEVGLGYLKLGQSATTLSGGEAQRVKLAKFLTKSDGNHTLYFFDEPTTGLHFDDVNRLLKAFNRLVEQGHSLIVIEHNLDVISQADWVIDIGPEGGFGGGLLVAEGTPEQIMAVDKSYTGSYLKSYMGKV